MSWFLWSILAALFAAATAILAKIGVADTDPNLAAAVRTSVVVIFTWIIAVSAGSHAGLVHIDKRSWLFLALSGVATGLSWICYFHALSLGPVSKVAPVDKLSVVFVIIAAWPFLGEKLTPGKLLGGGLIATGAIILALS